MSVIDGYTFLSVITVSLISFVGVFALSLGEGLLRRYVFLLVSLATGALLGDAFIHLIPESFAGLDSTLAGILVIAGMLLFFILEKALHWHHYHGKESEETHLHDGEMVSAGELHPVGRMVLISDGVHNFMDGVIIAASYLAGFPVGIATTIAVILHEIP
ncbi:MAG: zinc/iron permease, partial [Parcubacteria group bacterium Greene0416_14]